LGGTPADEDMLAVIVSAAEWSADEEEEVCDLFCSDGQDVQQGRVVELCGELFVFGGGVDKGTSRVSFGGPGQ
jgi:hypothetical protein